MRLPAFLIRMLSPTTPADEDSLDDELDAVVALHEREAAETRRQADCLIRAAVEDVLQKMDENR